jgi:hypothetical protein
MAIDANAIQLMLINNINTIINQLGGGAEIENINYTFANVDHKVDKTKQQITTILTGAIKKTFGDPEVEPVPVPSTFNITMSIITVEDLTPPIIP